MDFEWLPAGDAEFVVWMANFKEKLSIYAAELGLSLQDILEVEADTKALSFIVSQIQTIRQELGSRIELKRALRDGPESEYVFQYPGRLVLSDPPEVAAKPGIVSRLIRLASRIRSAERYSPEIGIELGIEQTMSEHMPWFPKHILPATDHGMVELDYSHSSWDGVLIECQRGDDPVWVPLGIAYQSPFVDARPAQSRGSAETRRYRLRFVACGEPVGIYSEIIQVVVPAVVTAGKARMM